MRNAVVPRKTLPYGDYGGGLCGNPELGGAEAGGGLEDVLLFPLVAGVCV